MAMMAVKEPVTGVEFPKTIGAGKELTFLGAGVREKKIAVIKVKISALGFYIDASSLANLSGGRWKGKSGKELEKDKGFFKALLEVPVEKAVRTVLIRDVTGAQFWGGLSGALIPRLKPAGAAGEEALKSLENVFKNRALKNGTVLSLTWSQPATLKISISSKGDPAAALDASIESAVLLPALFGLYLGEDPSSPTLLASIASTYPSLL